MKIGIIRSFLLVAAVALAAAGCGSGGGGGGTDAAGGGVMPYCAPHGSVACYGGDVRWFDTCGNLEGVYEDCGPGQDCESAACVRKYWAGLFGGSGYDRPNSVVQTADGGYAVAGYTWSFGAGGCDYWILKLDGSGAVQWQKTYGGEADDQAISVQRTPDGGYVVAGETQSYGAGDWDIWVVKLSEGGGVQWQKTYGGQGTDTSSAEPIQPTSDGGYVVTGRTTSYGAGEGDFWVLKLASKRRG